MPGRKMADYFAMADKADRRERAKSAGPARVPVSALDVMKQKLAFDAREYDTHYAKVQPLGSFFKILARRSSGNRWVDLVENRRLQLPLDIPV